MDKTLIKLAVVSSLLLLGACAAGSRIVDNNCSGNSAISNPPYCDNTLHPVAGPWATKKNG